MSEQLNSTVIEGAGGIVEHRSANGVRIAVIRRTRYGDEWALPKGKRRADESWQKTALREVEEEIEVEATIIGVAGATFYLANGVPKIVAYWRMLFDGEIPSFTPNDEVIELAWLPPKLAIRRLTHPEEVDVVRSVYPGLGDPGRNVCDRLRKQYVRCMRRRPLERLRSEINAYKQELMSRKASGSSLRILQFAERAVFKCDIEAGWKYLQAARRIDLANIADPAALEAAAITLRREAEDKLTSWRQKAVMELLADAKAGSILTGRLVEAAQIRDDHYNNEAYKDGLRRSNAARLAASLLLALAAFISIGAWGLLATLQSLVSNVDWKILVSLVVVGWLGASVSAVIALPRRDAPTRIPELLSTFRVTMLRLLMGPASAIILYFAMQTQLASTIFNFQADKGKYMILIVAFAAGFSERLVLRVIGALDRG